MDTALLYSIAAMSFLNTAHLEDIREKPFWHSFLSRIIGIAFAIVAFGHIVAEIRK